MSLRSTKRWPAALLGLGISLAAAPAAADATPVVRIQPVLRARGESRFDRRLPAGKDFTVQIRLADLHLADNVGARGTIDIWPEAIQPPGTAEIGKCAKDPPAGGDQHHQLALVLSGTGADRVLSATVPPLQIGQLFCFSLNIHPQISDAQIELVAVAAAKALAPALVAAPNCLAAATPATFEAAFTDALTAVIGAPPAGQSFDVKQPAALAAGAFRLTGAPVCSAVQGLIDRLDQMGQDLPVLQEYAAKARARIAAAPPPARFTDPFVLVNANPLLAGTAVAEETNLTPAQLRQAAAQLQQRSAGGAAYRSWAAALTKLADDLDQPGIAAADKKKAYADAAAAVKALHGSASLPLEIAKGDGFIPYAAYQKNPEAVPPSRVLAQLAQLDRPGVVPPKEQAKLQEVRKAVEAFQITRENLAGAQAAEVENIGKRNTALAALEARLQEIYKRADVRAGIEAGALGVTLADGAGSGETQNFANYVTPDLGIVLAAPTGGKNFQAWLMPYAGFTFYFTAVDRTVALDQLVGRNGQAFRQRVSLTLGMTLNDTSLPGRTLMKPLGFGNYPLAAVGVRLTSFVRITGGTIFYRIADPNPASGDGVLRVAPFVGGSLDADVVHALQKM